MAVVTSCENTIAESIVVQLIPYVKSANHYIVVGVIRHLCLQRGCLMLTYLIRANVYNFFIDFRK